MTGITFDHYTTGAGGLQSNKGLIAAAQALHLHERPTSRSTARTNDVHVVGYGAVGFWVQYSCMFWPKRYTVAIDTRPLDARTRRPARPWPCSACSARLKHAANTSWTSATLSSSQTYHLSRETPLGILVKPSQS